MDQTNWVKEFPAKITVTDIEGNIVEMNDASLEGYKKDGGAALIGKDVLACHPQPARDRLKEMMENQTPNVYTIEKNGQKKLIYQTPWYQDGKYAGFVEMSIDIPFDMPHFVRK